MKIEIEKIPDKLLVAKKEKYKIIDYIDGGGGGNVFLCNDSSDKEYAVKIFSRLKDEKRGIKRFKNEIKAHSEFDHPNLIKALDWGSLRYDGTSLPFYVMPKAKYNLKDFFVSNNIKNRPDKIKRIYIEILDGLIYMHQNKCYHRDLKPQNILVLGDSDKVAIADFGIAHLTEKYQDISIITDPEEILKNNKYWAPEQGSPDEDYKIDIYALGLIFHELTTGVFPRGTGYLISLENPLFDNSFDKIIIKMTKRDKNDRYQSLEEVKIDIERYFKMQKPIDERNILEDNIYGQLLKLDKKAADEFKSALSTLRTQEHFGRFSQSANSFNYICLLLRNLKNDWLKNPEIVPRLTFEYISLLFEKLSEICEYFSQLSSHKLDTNISEFYEQLLRFEEIISEILKSNLETLARLDILLEKKVPTHEDIEELIRLIKKPSHSQYFFSKLSSPDWIDFLKEKDFFIEPIAISANSLNVSIWPQVNYLIKISQYQPEKVLPIIKDLASTKNYRIYQPLLTCIYNMPTNISKEALSIVKTWFSYFYSIPELVVLKKLVNKFIFNGDIEYSYKLIEILYDVEEPEIKTERNSLDSKFYFLNSDYEDFLDKVTELDIQTSSNKYLELLCKKLSQLLDSTPRMDSKKFNDHSDIWRDSIESKPQGYETKDALNFLINQIRDYLNELAEQKLELVKTGFESLSKYKWAIFSRIQLNIINKYPDLFATQLNESLINQTYFATPIYWIEYYDLIYNNFFRLSDENKQIIFNWIRVGPDLKKEGFTSDDFTDQDKFQNYSKQFISSWVRRKAEPIKNYLPLDLKDKYKALILKNGELKHPQYYRYHEGPRFFSGSPLNKEQLAKLSNIQLIDYLIEWKPSKEGFFSTKDGLGVYLSREISENSKKRMDLIFDFETIPLIYLPYIISGFSDAIKGKKVTFIDIFIGIIEIFKTTRDNEEPVDKIKIWREIARLLQQGLKLETHDFSQDLDDELWGIISFLLNMNDPDGEVIDNNSYEDFTTYSINTLKGIILETFFHYAFFRARILDLPKDNRMTPKVEGKLNELLNPKIESVKIIRSILSLHLTDFYYLNEQWISTKISMLFPRDNRNLWKIAWESYIKYNKLNATIYPQLKEQYKIAINDMMNLISSEAMEYLAYHIITLYVNEIEDLSEGSIIKLFFKGTKAELHSRAMWFTIKVFDNVKDADEYKKFLERILEIWEYRIKDAKNNQKLTFKEKFDEFHWFGLLFEKLDIEESYLQLLLEILDLTEGQLDVFTHSILELLKKYVEINPQNVLAVIKKLLKAKSVDWLYSNTETNIIEIIEKINDNYDIEDFQTTIEEIAEILIEKGYPEIRNLKYLKL